VMGFSNGGFFSYALACAIGNQLVAVTILAAMSEVQPSCPQRTNVLHFHNIDDNYNSPCDSPPCTSAGRRLAARELGSSPQHNTPTALRTYWLEGSTGGTTNGASGVTTGLFTLYSAALPNKVFEYYMYDGTPEHAYMVYAGTPAGAPDGLTMENYINTFWLARSAAGGAASPSPSPPPAVAGASSPPPAPKPEAPTGMVEEGGQGGAAAGDGDNDANDNAAAVESSDPCFPASGKVTLQGGKRVVLRDLKPGDRIRAATADGSLTIDTVSVFSLADRDATSRLIAISTFEGAILTVTPAHHLPVGATCCSEVRSASAVLVNDTVWADTGSASAALVAHRVVRIDAVKSAARGLYSPVLLHGTFPIVDGVATAFDDIQRVALAKRALPTAEALCSLTGTCALFRKVLLGPHRRYVD